MSTSSKRRQTALAGFKNYTGLVIALLAMCAMFAFQSENFLSAATFITLSNDIPPLVVMAVGMTFILIIGGIDLSVGSVMALAASMLSMAMVRWGWPLYAAASLGVVVAAACGTVTGMISVHWRIPSFIVSLGVLEIARGLAYQVTNSRTEYIGSAVDVVSSPILLGMSPAFLSAIAIVVAAHLVLTRTVLGRYWIGIGTNQEAVRLSGVNPNPSKVLAFALMGAFAGIAALFQVSRLEAADPNGGVGMELQVIAAVVIGGTSLMGGRGSIISTFIGVLIISVLEAGLAQIGVSEPMKRIITGAVIVAAVILDTYRRRGERNGR
ncbi:MULTISPECIES: ABC transporter permease [unclassified Herbaspirillum]|uniref:ABC transporter permease n=1 Tax=unclassified Herbaspirillum TaxID=2624150 RepID=UPI00115324AB|nr:MULTISPECIES: ABC transporter permease [unclassified Herbaspirillum]MBB5393321.1 ribose transport system permease protein [Herbaspirillum sp. SJZ102]TQK03930.1 monosaccharide ABC transporter membrane protein (CUT2 family) [Herbaspirillum sp. SJZ130]TQK08662.1 monosaccharide ABC transporter membrane protein (CUT2 family) [Herbaspirillum sp. SJZ106]TWC71933.1 monosaccharide ABC transporter membrane protein (CUT2 family) [Herbaspirillum sp. SJZ099]